MKYSTKQTTPPPSLWIAYFRCCCYVVIKPAAIQWSCKSHFVMFSKTGKMKFFLLLLFKIGVVVVFAAFKLYKHEQRNELKSFIPAINELTQKSTRLVWKYFQLLTRCLIILSEPVIARSWIMIWDAANKKQ